jgi:hypothetical protein
MAYNTDPRIEPRGYTDAPRAPHETHIHDNRVAPPPRAGGNGLAFIVGGVVVAVVVLFLLFGGFAGNDSLAPGATAPVGNSTTINVEPTAPAPAAEEPAPLLEQPIPGVQTEPAPAPAD